MIRRALSLALASCAVAAPLARAAEPIMPLSEVRAGMACTGLSVIRGTEVASFDVEVLDVIAEDPEVGGARILVRVSGPAVDTSGVGPGFSGSPVLCGGRNAGAISEAIGDYGNKVVLATPIESILDARPARAPTGARRAPGLLRSARSLAGPLTVSGLSTGARRLLARAARRAGQTVLAAPPGPLGGYPVQDPRPGAAVAASIATGDLSLGSVGTVAYRDGDRVYAFGHALDGVGPRKLFLQDTYVFGVIANPLGVPDLGAITYKLTSSGGHDLGAITNDTFGAIYGATGAGPPSVPLRVSAREPGAGTVRLRSRLADERPLGLGTGMPFVAPLGVSTAIDRLLGSLEPATLRLCSRFRVAQLRRALGFCNTYFDTVSASSDVADASSLVDDYDLGPLTIEDAAIGITARRGVVDDVIVGADAPRRVRRGRTLRVRVALRRRGGGYRTATVRVPVPRDLRPGARTLVIAGSSSPAGEEEFVIELLQGLSGASASASARPVRSQRRGLRRLARRVAALHRPVGIAARFRPRAPRLVLRSDRVRFSGRAKVAVRVLRRAARR